MPAVRAQAYPSPLIRVHPRPLWLNCPVTAHDTKLLAYLFNNLDQIVWRPPHALVLLSARKRVPRSPRGRAFFKGILFWKLLFTTTDIADFAVPIADLTAGPARKKRSGRSFEPADELRRIVTVMGSVGTRHSDIALALNIDPKTLRKHFRRELDTAAISANVRVTQSLFAMATSRRNSAAAIFWAKTRCGFRSTGSPCDDDITPKPSSSHSSPKPPGLAPAVRAPLPEPVAYNNDGEPNVEA